MHEFDLKSCIKNYTLDQDKVISPEETVKKVFNLLSNCDLDILQKIIRANTYKFDIPVYLAKGGVDFISVVNNSSHTWGKGVTHAQAQASALMELIERFSAFSYSYFSDSDKNIFYSYNEIKDKVPDIKYLFPLLTHVKDEESVFKELSNIPLHWTMSYNLTKQKFCFMPLIFNDITGSNGLAAGNTIEEAIFHGICEIIERHVFSKIELEKIITPEIDIESIKHPLFLSLIEKFNSIKMDLIFKDFTLDLEIPTIAAIGRYKDGIDKHNWRYIGVGTHTDPLKAIFRALTELVQINIHNIPRITMKDEEIFKFAAQGVIKSGMIDKNTATFFEKNNGKINFNQIKNYFNIDIKNEIETTINILAKKNIDIIVINQTHPLLNIPVVRVIGTNTIFNCQRTTILNIYFYQGICYKRIKEYDKALISLNKAKKEVEYPDIYKEIALCYNILYNETGNNKYRDLAIENFKQAVEISKEIHLPTYCQLSKLLVEKGEKYQAQNYFKQVLKINPLYKNIVSNKLSKILD